MEKYKKAKQKLALTRNEKFELPDGSIQDYFEYIFKKRCREG